MHNSSYATIFTFFLLCFLLFDAYGQTVEEKVRFVEVANKRILASMSTREQQLESELGQLKTDESTVKEELEKLKASFDSASYEADEKELKELESTINETSDPTTRAQLNSTYQDLKRLLAEKRETSKENSLRIQKLTSQYNNASNRYIAKEIEFRMTSKRNSDLKTELLVLKRAWRSQVTEENFSRLALTIRFIANELSIKSNVSFSSQKSSGEKTSGARVRAQGDDERRSGGTPRYSCITGCEEKNLEIGWYYFWTERNSKKTSDENFGKFIIEQSEVVQLVEDR